MGRLTISNITNNEPWPNKAEAEAHFTQSELFGQWQIERGFKVRRLVLKDNDRPILWWQALTAPLIRRHTQIYIPHGPIVLDPSDLNPTVIKLFKEELFKLAREDKAVFVRLDPQIKDWTKSALNKNGFKTAPAFAAHSTLTQPRYEWIMDLIGSETDWFNRMSKDTRYSIRTAQKRGTVTEIINENLTSELNNFYQLVLETSKRNNFRLHPKSYYEKVLSETSRNQSGFIVKASFNGIPLVMNLITTGSPTALHVFGGSTTVHRDQLASYLAHWAGFIEAKRQGATTYSFGGISFGEDQNPSWVDLTAFKQKFPGHIKDYGPLYDLPISRLWYYAYVTAKKFR
ncbi:MAG: hypothetical protein A2589_00250 [Candidatus Vogelbacteria bacterium RIFOXYD1_FULL_46_19]|uniref:BioF2-like acetyltransferase domain-containing protein n=1 Tax=Candidatus Vogelbacteria bacterium RIFOXYD1_FULL_46_19 TaxID=1802439 RepID=A0A1G2QHN8_9BACT|nr:MAG: hypothetical protein A2589_00250 [Candidatus Vogelbacteria bacterium RIFOXYD1_FULL_46_19]